MCQPLRIQQSSVKIMDSQNPASRLAAPPARTTTIVQQSKTKSTFRLSPFRKIAKSTRINLNRYWGLLSKINISKSNVDSQYAEEIEQNRVNELMEAQMLASSQNSINSQVEEYFGHYYNHNNNSRFSPISSGYGSPILSNHSNTTTPPPSRKMIKPTPLAPLIVKSSCSNCSCSSSIISMDFDEAETSSQDSLFL